MSVIFRKMNWYLKTYVTKGPWISSVCRNHNPVLSSFMTYHWVFIKNNTTGAPEFNPCF